MKHLDLFSGIGGFALAARWAGFETVAFCEKDLFCQKVLFKHWPDVITYPDIKTLDFATPVDLLTAGFPCQPFSTAGKQKGKDDDRYMWPDCFRIIRNTKPNWIILENVPGILPHTKPIFDDLERESYDWRGYLVPASCVGAPHKRERLWIIAYRNVERCDYGRDNWEKRCLQENFYGYMAEIQPKWEQLIPNAWKVMQARDWLEFNADLGRSNDGIPNRVDRIKALGNAIVPQIAYVFMKIIKCFEENK